MKNRTANTTILQPIRALTAAIKAGFEAWFARQAEAELFQRRTDPSNSGTLRRYY